MLNFKDWCTTEKATVGLHELRVVTVNSAKINIGIAATAGVVPSHYASEERIARILARLAGPVRAGGADTGQDTDCAIHSKLYPSVS